MKYAPIANVQALDFSEDRVRMEVGKGVMWRYLEETRSRIEEG